MNTLWNFQPAGTVTAMAFMFSEGSLMYSTFVPFGEEDVPLPPSGTAVALASAAPVDAEAGRVPLQPIRASPTRATPIPLLKANPVVNFIANLRRCCSSG
jgi:hypothetical protein